MSRSTKDFWRLSRWTRSPFPWFAATSRIFREKPSEYIRSGQVWTTCEIEEKALPQVIRQFNPRCLMWPSDYPHEQLPDMFKRDIPGVPCSRELKRRTKRLILYENPVRFYNLEI